MDTLYEYWFVPTPKESVEKASKDAEEDLLRMRKACEKLGLVPPDKIRVAVSFGELLRKNMQTDEVKSIRIEELTPEMAAEIVYRDRFNVFKCLSPDVWSDAFIAKVLEVAEEKGFEKVKDPDFNAAAFEGIKCYEDAVATIRTMGKLSGKPQKVTPEDIIKKIAENGDPKFGR